MTEAAPAMRIDWERLARAELHPVRIDILEVLLLDGGRTLSASEIAFELQRPLSNVSYHVKALLRGDFLVVVAHRQARGATEHFLSLPGRDGRDVFRREPFC